MRKYRKFILLVVVLAGVIVFLTWDSGVRAIVRNRGTTTLRDVHVNVKGNSYAIGDIRAGESRTVRVRPWGKSDIQVTFSDPDGNLQQLTINCYLEHSHYGGHITIDLADGKVMHVDDAIHLSFW